MSQPFTRGNPPAGIQRQTLVEKVDERHEHLVFLIVNLGRGWWHQSSPQIAGRFGDVHLPHDILSRKQRQNRNSEIFVA